jgi:hypothetical protein
VAIFSGGTKMRLTTSVLSSNNSMRVRKEHFKSSFDRRLKTKFLLGFPRLLSL